jgi:hypothetical protein
VPFGRRSSNLLLGTPAASLDGGFTGGSGAAVARLLAKEKVASSNLVFRSIDTDRPKGPVFFHSLAAGPISRYHAPRERLASARPERRFIP